MQQYDLEATDPAFEYSGGDIPSSRTHHNTEMNLGMQCSIFLTGISIGLLLFGPNIMMCDSGTDRANAAANLGVWACVLFIGGGIVGGILNRWSALLPGVICQLLAFTVLGQ
jgi:hypothetical protein